MSTQNPKHQLKPGPGRRPKYPWNEWTDGSVWEVTRFQDYYCATTSFVQALYKHEKVDSAVSDVHAEIHGDKVYFQFVRAA